MGGGGGVKDNNPEDQMTTYTFARGDDYLVKSATLQTQVNFKPNYTMTFYNADSVIGTLDFNGDVMKFEGKAEESAKVFLDSIAKSFAGRLEKERAKAMEWRPIDSAPRDGEEILVSDGHHFAVARWDEESWPDADKLNSCWSISDWHNDPIHLRGGYMITHWMPLPKPPKDKE